MSDEVQAQIRSQSEADSSTTTLALDQIRPDPSQPRRLLPDDLAENMAQGTLSPVEVVTAWLSRADTVSADIALRRNVTELKRLAASIEQHGLINPISVREPMADERVSTDTAYLIVTGERRFWAHVYLLSTGKTIHEGETISDPTRIKATISPPGVTIRAHQFIENLLREDINAIERAFGMWALRYELSGIRNEPVETLRVNHGSPPDQLQDLVPWTRVEEMLGISKRYRIFTIGVLNLSAEAQALIENHNLAERTVRPIVQKLKDKPHLQLKALNQLISWQNMSEPEEGGGRSVVASVKELVEKLLADETARVARDARAGSRAVSSAPVIRFRSKVRQTLDFLNRLKTSDKADLRQALEQAEFADVIIDLRNLRQQIDVILAQSAADPAKDALETAAPAEKNNIN